jgi:hypothetical protein
MDEPTRRAITTRSEFLEALRSAFSLAADTGAREILLCDADFADWPLGESSVLAALTRWVGSRRRLLLLAQNFEEVVKRHGRWTEWRRQWSHVVQCRSDTELEAAQYPTICLVPEVFSVRLFDRGLFRGLASSEPADALACREAIDAVSQRSGEAFPVTTLGL